MTETGWIYTSGPRGRTCLIRVSLDNIDYGEVPPGVPVYASRGAAKQAAKYSNNHPSRGKAPLPIATT